MESLLAYLPQDRRAALAAGTALPTDPQGAALFADIVGFTPLTEGITQALGPRRGADVLIEQINIVYDGLITAVDRAGGSVIGFAGDSITCWFDDAGRPGTAARRATACAFALQAAMTAFTAIPDPAGAGTLALALKAAVATGPARRFLVGDPAIGVIEVLAGRTLFRLAQAEHLAQKGEVVVDAATVAALGNTYPEPPSQWRQDAAGGDRFAVLAPAEAAPPAAREPVWAPRSAPAAALRPDQVRPWLPQAVYDRLISGQSDFLTELRPAVALFLRFGDLDYDDDPDAGAKLDRYIRWVQQTVAETGGTLLQVSVGDKGNYLYAVWGAPTAHEDDARRAVAAAQALRTPPPGLEFSTPVHMGLSRGVMRTGACGSATRRTYGVMGDEVNLTARLMEAAAPGQVLTTGRVYTPTATAFAWEPLPAIRVKGKRDPIPIYALQTEQAPATIRLHEPHYQGPLLGRDAAQAQIAACLQRARQGEGQVVGISGEAGLGKSRLVAEVVRRSQAEGWRVFGGAAESFGTRTPYLAWTPLWRAFFALTAGDSPAAQAAQVESRVAALAPTLRARTALLGAVLDLTLPETELTASMDEKLRKESREGLLVALLRASAQDNPRPLLLVLDDAHWLDPLSHDLLDAIGRALYNLPVAILVAYRPPARGAAAALRVAGLPHFTEVPVQELAPPDAARLVAVRVAARWPAAVPVPAAVVTALAARAEGNPFYLEELVNYLAEQGLDAADPAALAQVEWPSSLHSLVLSRIDQLPERQQRMLKVASIIGRLFAVAWLLGYYPALGDTAQVGTELEEIAWLELTVRDTPEPELAYLFKHIVTQEVAYQSLAEATRQRLHGQLAAWIEQTGSQDLDLLAFHYSRSAEAPKAREYLRKAGDAAAAAYNHGAARDYYEQWLARLPAGDAAEGEARVALGDALEQAGAWDQAAAQYRMALAGAAGPASAQTTARALLGLGVVQIRQGDFPAAIGSLESARAAFVAAGAPDAAGRAEAELGWVYCAQGEYGRARAVLDHVLGEAAPTRARAFNILGEIGWRQGDFAAARRHGEEARALYQALGDRMGLARTLITLGRFELSGEHYPAARALYEESLAIYRELGNRAGTAAALNNVGIAAYYQGEYATAQALQEESMTLCRELGDRLGIARAHNNLGTVTEALGDYGAAQERYAAGLALFRELGDRWGIANSLGNLGEVTYYQGDDPAARALLEESLALRRALGDHAGTGHALQYLGSVTLRGGQVAAAQALWEESLAVYRSLGDRIGIAACLINLGAAAYAQGAQAEAEQHFVAGLRESQASGAIRESLGGVVGLAAVAASAGRPATAARWLAAVTRQATAMSYRLDPLYGQLAEATASRVRATLGAAAHTAAQDAGAALVWEAVLAEALAG